MGIPIPEKMVFILKQGPVFYTSWYYVENESCMMQWQEIEPHAPWPCYDSKFSPKYSPDTPCLTCEGPT